MAKKKKSMNQDQRTSLESKKNHVLNQPKRQRRSLYITLTAGLLVFAAVMAFKLTDTSRSGPPPISKTNENQSASPDRVVYPAAMFQDGVARHFEHQTGDVTIRYFILKSSDGVLRAAFDACDVCWPAGKGYEQQGDEMVCRNCGRRFASIRINEVQGGCNPAPLKRELQADQLIIRVNDILQGSAYFNFKRKA
jgi:uncharacterized membrane protein